MNDPKLQHCQCGYSWRPGTLEKVIMLVHGSYVKTCPRCQSKMKLVLVHHVVKVDTETVLDERIWKNS